MLGKDDNGVEVNEPPTTTSSDPCLRLRARAAKLGRWQLWREPESDTWGAAIVGPTSRVRAVAATAEEALTVCCEKMEVKNELA